MAKVVMGRLVTVPPSDTTRRGCLFCGSTENKTSAEHLFHESFGRAITPAPTTVRIDYAGTDDPMWRKELPVSMFQTKVNGVCVPCNSTWMNDADMRIEHLLTDLALGRGDKIPASDIAPFASWATKVALLRAEINRSAGWQADPELFDVLYETRLPPPGTVIRVGRLTHRMREGGSNGVIILAHHDGDNGALPDHPEEAGRVNVVCWQMGMLFVHVLLSSGKGRSLARSMHRATSRITGGALRVLWHGDRRGVTLGVPLTIDAVARSGNALHLVDGTAPRPEDYLIEGQA